MTTPFDTKILLSLIKEKPVIWDKTSEIYKNKSLRIAAWREICVTLKEDFDNIKQTERQTFARTVTRKWNQVRDSWIRSLTDKRSTKRKYLYHNQMLFLKKVVSPALTNDNVEKVNKRTFPDIEKVDIVVEEDDHITSSDEESADGSQGLEYSGDSMTKIKRYKVPRQNPSSMDQKMISFIDHHLKSKQNADQENCNLTFLRSLLPSLSLLNDDQILEFQSGVIKVLQNIRSHNYNKCSSREPGTFLSPQNDFSEQYSVEPSSSMSHQNVSNTESPLIPSEISSDIDIVIVKNES